MAKKQVAKPAEAPKTVREQLEAKTKEELVDIAEKLNNNFTILSKELDLANQTILKLAKGKSLDA